jgi:hypothetical protein
LFHVHCHGCGQEQDGGREAAEALRSLIGEIVLNPGKKRGEVHAELRGELMGILEFSNTQEIKEIVLLCRQCLQSQTVKIKLISQTEYIRAVPEGKLVDPAAQARPPIGWVQDPLS